MSLKKIVVVCLLIHTLSCQSTGGFGSSGSCDLGANPALSSLKTQAGIPDYQLQLRTDTSVCKGEWDRFQSCCPSNIKSFLSDRATRTNKFQWNSYLSKLYVFRNRLFPSIQKFIQKIAYNKAKYRQLALMEQRKRGGCSMSLYSDSFIDMMNSFLSNFEIFLSSFKSDANTCYRKLSVFRANAACGICSGRGAQLQSTSTSRFRYGDKVLKITQDTCSNILTSCGKVFRFNFLLGHTIQIIQAYRSTYGRSGKARVCSNKFDQFQMDQLNAALVQCLSTNFASCSQANLALLCESFLNYEKPSAEVEGDATLVDDESQEDTSSTASSIDSSRRVLQGAGSGGVEVVANSDVNALGAALSFDTSSGLADSKVQYASLQLSLVDQGGVPSQSKIISAIFSLLAFLSLAVWTL